MRPARQRLKLRQYPLIATRDCKLIASTCRAIETFAVEMPTLSNGETNTKQHPEKSTL